MRKENLSIVQTPARFFPDIGGVNYHVLYLGKELVKIGYKVKVICAAEPPSDIKTLHGIEIERLPYSFKVTNSNITLSFPWKILKTRFDIMHTHMPTPWSADWSVLISKVKRKKVVFTIHNDLQKSGFLAKLITDIYLNTVFRISLFLADKIIVVNPDWKESFPYTKNLLQPHEKKLIAIPNGVDTSVFKQHGKRESDTILFVSVLDIYHGYKGLDYLLKAMKTVVKGRPHAKLQIVGEGELKKKYQDMVSDMNLEKNVEFLGAMSQEELATYFAKATVFVLPSIDTEGFGIVLLEAMACETPVVATEIVGVSRHIKKHKSGYIVKPKDTKALSKNILAVLNNRDEAREMGINGRRLIEKQYSWSTIAKVVSDIYQTL